MLCITLDTDWVPDFVLQYALEILSAYQIRATIFFTSPYDLPFLSEHETALHPNLMSDATTGDTESARLHYIHKYYPNSKGVRTHRLYWHSGLHSQFLDAGLKYDSSLFCPLQKGLMPYNEVGLIRFPIWWVDNYHARRNFGFQHFDPPGVHEQGLKVLLFHPLQIYLNTRTLQEAKGLLEKRSILLQDERDLANKRRSGAGFETLFISALGYANSCECSTLSQLLV